MLDTSPARDYHSVDTPAAKQAALYEEALASFGPALNRLAASYEFDPERRRDLAQEIHFQLWRSLELFDGRCSLKTWTFRVAHNTAASYIIREHRTSAPLVSLEDAESAVALSPVADDPDRTRALERLRRLIANLKPLDRQIMLCYLEDMDAASIAEITGLSPGNVAMKIHRSKAVLVRRFPKEQRHA